MAFLDRMDAMGTEIERVDTERADRIIWANMGLKSVREIAEAAGVSPEDVLRRKKEMLEEIDVLTIQEKRQRLLVELDGMARDAREKAKNIDAEFYAGTINSSVAAIKAMLAELSRMDKQDTSAVEELNQMRVRELVSLMSAVVNSGVQEVSSRYDLDEDEVYAIFNDRLIAEAEARDMA